MGITRSKIERDFFDDIEDMIREEEDRMKGLCDRCKKKRELKEVFRGKDIMYICSACEEALAPYMKPTKEVTGKRIGGVFVPD